LYDIRPGNGAGVFLQTWRLHGAQDIAIHCPKIAIFFVYFMSPQRGFPWILVTSWGLNKLDWQGHQQ